jgi:hypothetical protein
MGPPLCPRYRSARVARTHPLPILATRTLSILVSGVGRGSRFYLGNADDWIGSQTREKLGVRSSIPAHFP